MTAVPLAFIVLMRNATDATTEELVSVAEAVLSVI